MLQALRFTPQALNMADTNRQRAPASELYSLPVFLNVDSLFLGNRSVEQMPTNKMGMPVCLSLTNTSSHHGLKTVISKDAI